METWQFWEKNKQTKKQENKHFMLYMKPNYADVQPPKENINLTISFERNILVVVVSFFFLRMANG